MAGSASIQLAHLIADLRALPSELRKELIPAFKQAAEEVLVDARGRASWSRRIPPAMSLRARRSVTRPGASIIVNTARAPHARLYEFGQNGRSFRAPLFGDRSHWYQHMTRPYIIPAVRAGREGFIDAADRAVVNAARQHGFR